MVNELPDSLAIALQIPVGVVLMLDQNFPSVVVAPILFLSVPRVENRSRDNAYVTPNVALGAVSPDLKVLIVIRVKPLVAALV